MTLQDYTTEELRAELKRRKDLVKEERIVPTCDLKDGDILSYQTVRFATEEEKQKLFKAIKDNGYEWNAETKTLKKLVKPKFDPKTLQPFDKVLIRRSSENYNVWFPDFVSDPPNGTNNKTLCMCVMEDIVMVIPYNDDTKHLVGTSDEAPEYYRYWED